MLRSAVCNWSIATSAQSLCKISTVVGVNIVPQFLADTPMITPSRPAMRSFSALANVRSSVRARAVTSGENDVTAVPSASASTRKLRTLSKKNAAAAKAPVGSGDAPDSPVADPQPGTSSAEAEEADRKVCNFDDLLPVR